MHLLCHWFIFVDNSVRLETSFTPINTGRYMYTCIFLVSKAYPFIFFSSEHIGSMFLHCACNIICHWVTVSLKMFSHFVPLLYQIVIVSVKVGHMCRFTSFHPHLFLKPCELCACLKNKMNEMINCSLINSFARAHPSINPFANSIRSKLRV